MAIHLTRRMTSLAILGLLLAGCATIDDQRLPPGTICAVHGIELQTDTVKIIYGLMQPMPGYQREHYPHANTWSHGGCIITDDSPKKAQVSYCPECRRAEAEWMERHESTKARRKS